MTDIASHVLRLDPARCVRTRHAASNCTVCADACPQHAIELGRGTLTLRDSACTRCGLCASLCPMSALALDPADEALAHAVRARRATGAEVVVFACEGCGTFGAASAVHEAHAPNPTEITLPCLLRLGVDWALWSAAGGIRRWIWKTGDCAACECCSSGENAESPAPSAEPFLLSRRAAALTEGVRRAGGELSIEIVRASDGTMPEARLPTAPEAHEAGNENGNDSPASPAKRASFRRLFAGPDERESSANAADSSDCSDSTNRSFGPLLGRGALEPVPLAPVRQRLLASRAAFPRSFDAADLRLPDALPGRRSAPSRSCESCGLCVRFCPQEALRSEDAGIALDPVRCSGCGLCADLCTADALRMRARALGEFLSPRILIRSRPAGTEGDLLRRKDVPASEINAAFSPEALVAEMFDAPVYRT